MTSNSRPAPEGALEDYVKFGDVARDLCGTQCQYGSRYLTGVPTYPDLGKNLRWYGDQGNYYSLMIHKDDVESFVKNYKAVRGE